MDDDETVNRTEEQVSGSNIVVLGEIIWLLSHSTLHCKWPIASIHQWVFPALSHNYFRVYRRAGKPRGYVSWAWMSKSVESKYVLNTSSLKPEDWKSGDRGWVLDFVAPFGDAKEIVHDLKYNIFPNEVGRFLRVKQGSSTLRVSHIHGANALPKARIWQKNTPIDLGQLS